MATEIIKGIRPRYMCWVRIDNRDWEPACVAEYDSQSGQVAFEGVPFVFNNHTGVSTLWGKEAKTFDVARMVEYDENYQYNNKPGYGWRNPKTNYVGMLPSARY